MKSKVFICWIFFLSVISCTKESDTDVIEDPIDFEVPTIIPSGNEQYLELKSDYIFDQEKLHTFNLKLSIDNFSRINANPAAEQYVEGMLIFEGDTISPVGIRYKGSVGGFVGCVSGSDWTNPSGHKTCTKLSMKVKINWEGRMENFYGLKKLQFHSQNLDNSQMHERLGYWLFQQMGVPSPRSVHARLMINGHYSGLYALTEQIDGRFAKFNFDDDEGNVYKEVWPTDMSGNPHHDQIYINALKTNEDENPSIDIIKSFAQKIAAASELELQSVITEYMDIDEVISYAVVDRMIRNDDGPFHWYCGGGGCSNHNFYWYEEPTNKKIHLIPWDLDNAFENIINDANPVTPIANDWGEISNNCQPFNYGSFNFRQWSASCDKLTSGWVSFEQEYNDLKTQFNNGPFAESLTDQMIDKWSAQIQNATIEANQSNSDAITLPEWQNAINTLKSQLKYARNQ